MSARILLNDAMIGLVIPWPSGVIYQTQACGVCCMQPELEGVFVPLDADEVAEALDAWFVGPESKYRGSGARRGIDAEDADRIEAILRAWRSYGSFPVTIDRTRLADSYEAWIHVVLEGEELGAAVESLSGPGRLLGIYGGFGPYPRGAVLTWPNSD